MVFNFQEELPQGPLAGLVATAKAAVTAGAEQINIVPRKHLGYRSVALEMVIYHGADLIGNITGRSRDTCYSAFKPGRLQSV